MGIVEAVAIASLAVAAGSAYMQSEAQKDAASEQRKARNEQKAVNAAQAAQERRAQIREERIKRARVMQAAENTGTTGSSGALGAVSNISSQFGSNVGFNLGQISSANRISDYQQNAANDMTRASDWSAVGNVAGSIFSVTAPSLFSSGPSSQQNYAPVEERTW
jgi:hypothetical protein